MAMDTLWVFLNYLVDTQHDSGNSVFLIDAYIARQLTHMVNKATNSDIPYPITHGPHIEYLIPGGAKLGRNDGSYYIKTYSTVDLKNLIKTIY